MKIRKLLTLGTVVMALTGNVVGFAQGEAGTSKSTDASISFKQGSLTLDKVSNFNFGNYDWGIERLLKQDYPLVPADENVEVKYELIVTDNRGPGVGNGWRLTATLGPFVNGTQESLKGASILFGSFNSTLVLPEGVKAEGYEIVTEPKLMNPIVFSGGDAVDVVAADRGKTDFTGLGTWKMSWELDKIKLTLLDGTATDGSHKATMTWARVDSPLEGDSSNP